MAAQQRMAIWAAEEIDEDLQDVDLVLSIGNYPQNDVYDDAHPSMDEVTYVAQIQQQVAFAQIPDVVKAFIVRFHQAVLDNNLAEITVAYESGWNKYTEKFYAKTEWPEAEVIAPLVNDDAVFLILYRELYYRHVYSRLQPNVDDRFHSYENSCELFNYLLNSEEPVALELPEQWLWDIIDEFIYQFQSFCTWRSKIRTKTDDELAMLAEGNQVWSSYSVLNVLYSLIQKSKVNDYILAQQAGKSPEEIEDIVGEYGVRPLYRLLGYFSIIGLLRVHVLLGDFTLALKVMENVELNQKSPFTRVTACHVTTYYYVGFCYVMLQRYPDAIRAFVTILNFIVRMRGYHTWSYQYDQINKTAERMYALFAICNCLSPSRLDDNILNIVREKYGDQITKMGQGEEGLSAFEELFLYACPKFITANPPPYEDSVALSLLFTTNSTPTLPEPAQRHLALFLSDVKAQAPVPKLRSFLKLYTSLDVSKLAGFLDVDEEEMCSMMMVMKGASRSVVCRTGAVSANGSGEKGMGLLDGEMILTSDLNFVIDKNMVHIAESTIGRRYAGWFIKNNERAIRILDDIKSSPLPAPHIAPANKGTGEAKAGAAPQAQKGGPRQGGQGGGPGGAQGQPGQGRKVAWGAVKVAGA